MSGERFVDPVVIAEPSVGPVGPVLAPVGSGGHFGRWLVRRLGFGVLILLAVSVVVFVATQALPSDPARAILGRAATPQSIAALNQQLGLNKPVITQYTTWLGHLVTGNLGMSLAAQQPVSSLISGRIVNSITLLLLSAIIALPLSFLLGAITAVRRGPFDRILLLVAIVVSALPDFVIGITLVIVFATVVFQLLPAVALVSPGSSPLDHPTALVLPVATLVLLNVPYLYRLVRTSMLDVLGSEYVAMARLKGMPPRIVVARHALRNALLPAIQGSALVMGWLLGSVVVVETVFQYPGLGSALTSAVQTRDLPVIQAVVFVFAVGIVLFNLTADALTIYLTPKLRTGTGS
jgi:peptide/nickel transport system permease protein